MGKILLVLLVTLFSISFAHASDGCQMRLSVDQNFFSANQAKRIAGALENLGYEVEITDGAMTSEAPYSAVVAVIGGWGATSTALIAIRGQGGVTLMDTQVEISKGLFFNKATKQVANAMASVQPCASMDP